METIQSQFKHFVILCLKAEHTVAMPSKAVDDLWHEFLEMPEEYNEFCKNDLGSVLNHYPNAEMDHEVARHELRNNCIIACKEENINHMDPETIPSLFRVDLDLKVKRGYRYYKRS